MARNNYYRTAHWRGLKQLTHERDGWRCIVCGSTEALVCDHIKTRPNVDYPTPFDVLNNTRTLCGRHDRQVKERNGKRMSGGKPTIIGCDTTGTPKGGWRA